MHAAPSVSYPVGRSAFAARLAALLAGAGLAACTAWLVQAQAFGWRQGAAFAVALGCAAIAGRAWLRSPHGRLHWDGNGWQWQDDTGAGAGSLRLALDLQAHMLLRWQGEEGRARWLWVGRESDVSHWDALRRAVYSRASAPIPTFPRKGKESLSAGKPPAAEQ